MKKILTFLILSTGIFTLFTAGALYEAAGMAIDVISSMQSRSLLTKIKIHNGNFEDYYMFRNIKKFGSPSNGYLLLAAKNPSPNRTTGSNFYIIDYARKAIAPCSKIPTELTISNEYQLPWTRSYKLKNCTLISHKLSCSPLEIEMKVASEADYANKTRDINIPSKDLLAGLEYIHSFDDKTPREKETQKFLVFCLPPKLVDHMLTENVTAAGWNTTGKEIEYYVVTDCSCILLVPKDGNDQLMLIKEKKYTSGTTYSKLSPPLASTDFFNTIQYNPVANISPQAHTYKSYLDESTKLTITAPAGYHPSFPGGKPMLHCLTNNSTLFQTITGEKLYNNRTQNIDLAEFHNQFAIISTEEGGSAPLLYGQAYNIKNPQEEGKKILCLFSQNKTIVPLTLTKDEDTNELTIPASSSATPLSNANIIKLTKIPEQTFHLKKKLTLQDDTSFEATITLPVTAVNGNTFTFKHDGFEAISTEAFDKQGHQCAPNVVKTAFNKLADAPRKPFKYGNTLSITSGAAGVSLLVIAIKKHFDIIKLKNKKATIGLSHSEEEKFASLKKWRARSGLAGSALVALAAGLYAHSRRKTP